MKKFFAWLRDIFFAPHMELHVRLFHILAFSGSFISFAMGVLGIFTNNGIVNVAIRLAISALALVLLTYSRLTGRYEVSYFISIIAAFIAAYPVMFFTAGGYLSGMPAFFILAVVFTVFMLEGKRAIFFPWRSCCCISPSALSPITILGPLIPLSGSGKR